MKARLELYHGLSFEFESNKLQDILKEISNIETSIGWELCGKCKSNNTFPNYRQVGSDDFYEIKCRDCGAVLQLGTHKEGQTLYKKKMKTDAKGKAVKTDDGKAEYLPDGGWLKWNPNTKSME